MTSFAPNSALWHICALHEFVGKIDSRGQLHQRYLKVDLKSAKRQSSRQSFLRLLVKLSRDVSKLFLTFFRFLQRNLGRFSVLAFDTSRYTFDKA